MMESQTNPKEVKPQDLAGTESQGEISTDDDAADDAAREAFKKMMESGVWEYPKYPYGTIHHVEKMYQTEPNHDLRIECVDLNENDLRPYQAHLKIYLDLGTVNNSTNCILACLCFFKWDGHEYHPCPLVPGQDDIRFICVGHVDEVVCEAGL